MNGYSSTDFSDYMVYSENSKLVILDHPASLIIENKEDMPVMDGAEACYPVYAALAKACYQDIDQIELKSKDDKYNGNKVKFTNTINAYLGLLEKDVDLFFGARPSADQLEEAKHLGIELEVTPIGKEAFVFFVEQDNPIQSLTSDEIRSIYHGDLTNWNQVGGLSDKIIAYQRPENSGSQTMMEYFMKDISLKKAESFEVVSSMGGVIEHVVEYENKKGAIGYTFKYFLEGLNQQPKAKMIAVDGIEPTTDNIKNGTYPLTTNLCLVTRKNNENPYVQKMIDFILSKDGQYIIEQTGYCALPNKQE